MATPFPDLSAGFPAGPKTPEPASLSAASLGVRPPSPPRPRLRLKRRAVPHLLPPTQNFLASVAAAEGSFADIPIPSIEEPDPSGLAPDGFLPLPQTRLQSVCLSPDEDGAFLSVRGRSRFSPPKTPLPNALPSLSPTRYPDWSIDSALSSSVESSPDRECGSSRPSTARSTQTSSSSLFSRFSQLSDDDNCLSPEEESSARFKSVFRRPPIALRRDSSSGSGSATSKDVHSRPRTKIQPLRKAPWTRAMSSHLWATYILYLQDPKVTPFRVGKSCVPPHGVCLRVAREAKRSWKGAKAMSKTSSSYADASVSVAAAVAEGVKDTDDKSGSSTPTADAGHAAGRGAFMQWPHSTAATRAHLRELCRLKASTPGGGARGLQYMSRSPTPFLQAQPGAQPESRPRTMRAAPAGSSLFNFATGETFATRDMALSLAVSTSDAMQPQGPLARMTRSTRPMRSGSDVGPASAAHSLVGRLTSAIEAEEPSAADRKRLGSPFTARSYGPSSSSSLAAVLGLSTTNMSRQMNTVGSRRSLQSPVRLNRTGTNKRRSQQFGAGEPRKRPSLDQNLFTAPFEPFEPFEPFDRKAHTDTATMSDGEMDLNPAGLTRREGLFVPQTAAQASLTSSTSAPELATSTAPTAPGPNRLSPSRLDQPLPPLPYLSLPAQPPARLGSPFSAAGNASFSFPNRYSNPADSEAAPVTRPFATVQRVGQSNAVPARTNLASRMAYLDQRLRELNSQNDSRRHQ